MGGKTLHVYVGEGEVQALVEEDPKAFEAIESGRRTVVDWVRVHLAAADAAQVRELLEDAWRAKAPPARPRGVRR